MAQPSTPLTAAPAAEHVSAAPAVKANPTSPATDVSVIIPVPRADSSADDRVAIRLLQKGTEIHVSVRTPDTQLAQSLRQDIGKLTSVLDQAGFRTESWRPAITSAAAPANTGARGDAQSGPNREPGGGEARSGGNHGGGSGEQKRRQQDGRPRWVAELEQQGNS